MGKSRRSIIEKPGKPLPSCSTYLNQFTDGKRVYYPTEHGKYGVFVFKKGPGVALALFTESRDGTIKWHPRVVPNKKTGKPIFIYDLVEIHMAITDEVAQAILEISGHNFGTPGQIAGRMAESIKTDSEEDEVDKLLRKHGRP